MPGYKGHLAGGAIAGAAVLGGTVWSGLYAPSFTQMAVLGGLALLGALFPDVDTNSKSQHPESQFVQPLAGRRQG